MSWRIDDHPKGGLQITHLDAPRFTARWTTGEFPIDHVREGVFFWTDEGGAPEDSIHLYDFVWDQCSEHREMHTLMAEAVAEIETFIIRSA
jgi:hypothetical protein